VEVSGAKQPEGQRAGERLAVVVAKGRRIEVDAASMPPHWNNCLACWEARLKHVRLGPATRIYLAAGSTDMRKGFEGFTGWCAIVFQRSR